MSIFRDGIHVVGGRATLLGLLSQQQNLPVWDNPRGRRQPVGLLRSKIFFPIENLERVQDGFADGGKTRFAQQGVPVAIERGGHLHQGSQQEARNRTLPVSWNMELCAAVCCSASVPTFVHLSGAPVQVSWKMVALGGGKRCFVSPCWSMPYLCRHLAIRSPPDNSNPYSSHHPPTTMPTGRSCEDDRYLRLGTQSQVVGPFELQPISIVLAAEEDIRDFLVPAQMKNIFCIFDTEAYGAGQRGPHTMITVIFSSGI
ncbi:hypothetical protein C8F01DRAFT_1183302, partial [Mycena amicta]